MTTNHNPVNDEAYSRELFMKLLILSLVCLSSFATANEKMAFMYESADHQKSLWIQDSRSTSKVDVGFDFAIYPFLAKDGSEIVFVAGKNERELNVYLKNLESGKQTQITKTSGFVLHPHLSANKRYLAYSEFINNKNQIQILDRDTNITKTIAADESLYFPKLSSNGSFVVYQKTISNDKKQVVMDRMDTEMKTVLSHDFDKCMAPNLNFDDSQVLMTCFKNDQWNVYKVDLSTFKVEQITFTKFESFAPTFDRHNNIVFASNPMGNFALYKLNRNQITGTYSEAFLIARMDGDLYAPSISGDLSYRRSLPSVIPMPARSSFGAANIEDKIYLFGGHQGQEHTYPEESFLNRVDIYDISSNTWKEGAARPIKAHGYDVETCNGNLYAFGGFMYSADHKPKWKSSSRIDRYNPRTDEWTQVGSLREARSSNVVAKVGSKIYIIGGWNSTPKADNDYEGKFLSTIEVFDCKTEKLTKETIEMPNPLRRAFTGIVEEDKILLVGGLGVGSTHFELLNTVTEFDPKTLSFKDLTPLPFATFAPAAGILNGQLHVFGGMFKLGEYNYEYVSHIYNLEGESWFHTGRHMTETKGFSMVLDINNQLWVLGGHSYENEADSPVSTIEVWEK